MKKSQIRILAILAAIALLLGIALFALRYEKPQVQLPMLVQSSSENIINLTFSNQNGTFSFQKSGDNWNLSSDADFPVNEEILGSMLDTLCNVRPQAILENPNLEELGFGAPQGTISYNHSEGSGTILIGNMNAVTDQLYVLKDDVVYLTDTTLFKAFNASLLDLAAQYPIPKPDNHLRVAVENAHGYFALSCDPAQTGTPGDTWYLQQGSVWVPADQNAAYNYYFLTWDMHWKTTAGIITQDTDLSIYGLDKPQAIYTLFYGDQIFRLYLGENLPDGTTYAMCDGSNLIYTMDTLLATWLAEATSQSVIPQSE